MRPTSYYSMARNLFDKQQIKETDYFPSQDFKEMTNRLNYLKEVKGIGVFTSRPGMGKSYTLRCFASTLNENLNQLCYICLSTVSIFDFYRQFCASLGLDDTGSKSRMFRSIQEHLSYLHSERKQPLILVIDEAQFLNVSILNDLRMLMNFRYDSLNCFTLVLVGESYLNNILYRSVHEALRQRITVHYNFSGLSDNEVSAYISHKLKLSGSSENIIDAAAVSAITGYVNGNMRLIDNIMTDAITIGAQNNKTVIDADTVRLAIENQKLL